MTDEDRAYLLWQGLNDCHALNDAVAITTVTHWLEYHGAGLPDVVLLSERVRDDAALWAASAHQTELEAYLAAALMALEKSPLTNRAAKRLAALGFKSMDIVSREAFREWTEKN